jgi:hypothetical protein
MTPVMAEQRGLLDDLKAALITVQARCDKLEQTCRELAEALQRQAEKLELVHVRTR